MTIRQQLIEDIKQIDASHLEALHHIILAFKVQDSTAKPDHKKREINTLFDPRLRGSVTHEGDIISPIDIEWEANQ